MDRPTCVTCPYWDTDAYDDEDEPEQLGKRGLCRRLPPRVIGNDSTCHPDSYWFEWCGEHPDFPAYLASLKQPATFPDPDTIDAESA